MSIRSIRTEAGSSESDTTDDWLASDRPLATSPTQLKDTYVEDKSPLTWSDAVSRFRANSGPEGRFGQRWAKRLWGCWLDRDRSLLDRTETTLMLTLTASPWLSDNRPLPPAHHLDAVVRGREAVLDELDDCLDCEYRVGWALGAQQSGYVDCHVGAWCFEETDPITAEPALQSYTDTVHNADESEHGADAITAYHGDDMLAERTVTDEKGVATRVSAYLADNVPGSGSQPEAGKGVTTEADAGDFHRLKAATVLDATGTDVYRRPARP